MKNIGSKTHNPKNIELAFCGHFSVLKMVVLMSKIQYLHDSHQTNKRKKV